MRPRQAAQITAQITARGKMETLGLGGAGLREQKEAGFESPDSAGSAPGSTWQLPSCSVSFARIGYSLELQVSTPASCALCFCQREVNLQAGNLKEVTLKG